MKVFTYLRWFNPVLFFLLSLIFIMPLSFSEEDKNELLRGKLRRLESTILDEVKETAKLLEEKNKLIVQLQQKLKDYFQREETLTFQLDQFNEEVYQLRKDSNYSKSLLESKERDFNNAVLKIKILEEENKIILQLQEKLKAFSQREENLTASLNKANKDIYKLSQDISYLTKDLESKEERFKEAQIQMKSLEEADKRVVQLQEQVDVLSQTEKKLTADNEGADNEIYKLNQDISYLNKEAKAKSEELKAALLSISQLKDENKIILKLQAKIKSLSDREIELTANLDKANKENYLLKKDVNYQSKEVRSRDKDLQDAEKKIRLLEEENKRIFQLEEKLAVSDQREKDAVIELDKANKEIVKLNTELNALSGDVENKNRKLKSISELEKLLEEKNKLIFQMDDKIKSFSQKETETFSHSQEVNKENYKLNKETEYLRKELENKNEEIALYQEKIKNLGEESNAVSQLKETLTVSMGNENNLNERLKEANNEIYQLKQDISYLKKEMANKDAAMLAAKDNAKLSSEKDKNIAQLEGKLSMALQKEQELTASLSRADEKYKQFVQQINSFSKENQEKDEVVLRLQEEIKSFSEKELAVKDLTKILTDKNREVEELKQKIDDKSDLSRKRMQEIYKEIDDKDKEIEYLKRVIKQAIDKIKLLSVSASPEYSAADYPSNRSLLKISERDKHFA